jgi:hypothetical protein
VGGTVGTFCEVGAVLTLSSAKPRRKFLAHHVEFPDINCSFLNDVEEKKDMLSPL